eukprot:m.39181 g.39181  ORF g.39181 m.39181 type:complete len:395 (+) comp12644_c0_seq4:52-1236(+)
MARLVHNGALRKCGMAIARPVRHHTARFPFRQQSSQSRQAKRPLPFPYNVLKDARHQLPHKGTGLHVTDYFPFSVLKTSSFQYARRPFWLKPLFFIPVGTITLYLLSRLEKMDVSGRWRLMPIPIDWYQTLIAPSLDEALYAEMQSDLMSKSSKEHKLVKDIVTYLVQRNDLDPALIENVYVLREDSEPNAFCTGGGMVVVHTALLDLLNNDVDQIAMVLGHEIAHYLCYHNAEQAGFQLLAVLAIHAMGVKEAIGSMFWSLFFQLPRSRLCEVEADHVGLQLTANACFDIGKAGGVWLSMMAYEILVAQAEELGVDTITLTYSELQDYADARAIEAVFSTHPSWADRLKNFAPESAWMQEARAIQADRCQQCPKPVIKQHQSLSAWLWESLNK